jgi:hypothetical protein
MDSDALGRFDGNGGEAENFQVGNSVGGREHSAEASNATIHGCVSMYTERDRRPSETVCRRAITAGITQPVETIS